MRTVLTTFPWTVPAVLACAWLAGCPQPPPPDSTASNTAAPAASASAASEAADPAPDPMQVGQDAYDSANCAVCHGPDGDGSSKAPPLRKLAPHWDEARLQAYLADPAGYIADDPRLTEQQKRYTLLMPAVSEQWLRDKLVPWLLAR
jgi:mono/diheme cytochrome c family protein